MKKRDDKPAALDHVLYEIEMLINSLLALSRPGLSARDASGWLEVFAVHARNLNEFFGPKDPGAAYMRPDHFISWTDSYQLDTELARRASGQISHLTYDRERPEEKTSWPFEKHFTALRTPSVKFLTAVMQVESLMSYHRNRSRAAALLEVFPEIRFNSVQHSANVASPNA